MFMDIAIIVNVVLFIFVFFESIYTMYRSFELAGKFMYIGLAGSFLTMFTALSFIFAQLYFLFVQDIRLVDVNGQYLWLLTDYLYAITSLAYTVATQMWITMMVTTRRIIDVTNICTIGTED